MDTVVQIVIETSGQNKTRTATNKNKNNTCFTHQCHVKWKQIILKLIFTDDFLLSWWRHQMETFSALLVICAGNSTVPGEFHTQRPVTRSFDVFFDLRLNKRLSKQSWGWLFETLSHPLWRHHNGVFIFQLRHVSCIDLFHRRIQQIMRIPNVLLC